MKLIFISECLIGLFFIATVLSLSISAFQFKAAEPRSGRVRLAPEQFKSNEKQIARVLWYYRAQEKAALKKNSPTEYGYKTQLSIMRWAIAIALTAVVAEAILAGCCHW